MSEPLLLLGMVLVAALVVFGLANYPFLRKGKQSPQNGESS